MELSETEQINREVRRRVLLRWGCWGVLMLAVASSYCSHHFANPSSLKFEGQRALVTHVVDGDTLDAKSTDGSVQRVRLKGIDAPEHDAYWGPEATKYLTNRTLNKQVILKLDGTDNFDKYGRLLAFIYMPDTECINLSMVRDGQAYMHRRYADHFMHNAMNDAENGARKKGSGLWKEVQENQMPQWRQEWLDYIRKSKAKVE